MKTVFSFQLECRFPRIYNQLLVINGFHKLYPDHLNLENVTEIGTLLVFVFLTFVFSFIFITGRPFA